MPLSEDDRTVLCFWKSDDSHTGNEGCDCFSIETKYSKIKFVPNKDKVNKVTLFSNNNNNLKENDMAHSVMNTPKLVYCLYSLDIDLINDEVSNYKLGNSNLLDDGILCISNSENLIDIAYRILKSGGLSELISDRKLRLFSISKATISLLIQTVEGAKNQEKTTYPETNDFCFKNETTVEIDNEKSHLSCGLL